MKKLLYLVDNYLLKIGVLFTLAFLALYPKLPSVHIVRTWVYIRLEDFAIAAIVAIWLIQLLRRKVRLALPVGIPIGMYWLAGAVSLLFSLFITGPHLVGFFPHLAILEYGRRLEYMILFFVAFSTVRSIRDLRDYIVVLCLTIVGVIIYGFGQRYYLNIWTLFPSFFEKYPFCFPSFQTGNEEFAKGLALCLPSTARIPSTFGGHYDLAAYLVIILPVLLGVFFSIKKRILQVGVGTLFILSLILLLFTASRISFFSYLLGVSTTLIFLKKKKWLIPVLGISIIFLFTFSGSTAKRLFETFRVVNVVTNNSGQVVGIAETKLPSSLAKKVSKTDSIIVEAPPPTENLPSGSSFITLPQIQAPVATQNALVKTSLTTSEALRLKLANGGLQISTLSGSFLIQKALVYDISFTTRFQAEWPNAWVAYMSNPFVGKGYSTITLATDNDYLRLLGESGILGFVSFILIFIIFGIFLRETVFKTQSIFVRSFALGLAGGVIGLFANASLIDVFEASKVAETLWILLGVAVGALSLEGHIAIPYLSQLRKIVTSHFFLALCLLMIVLVVFGGGITNFFVADDFTWLKWAAVSNPHAFGSYFTNAQGFFYRPIDKIVMYFMYTFFSFQPNGYHVTALFEHFFIGLGVYILGIQIFKKKLWAWVLSACYLAMPIHAEILFWISTISGSLSALFMTYSLVAFVLWRKNKNIFLYVAAILLGILAAFSYEMAIVLPLLFLIVEFIALKRKIDKKMLLAYVPFIIIDIAYLFLRSHSNVAKAIGDYSYSISHLVPNIFGNFIGYFVVTLFGERALSYHVMLRQALKAHALAIGMLLTGLLIILFVFLWKKRKMLFLFFGNQTYRLTLFGFLFAFIGLLPFLGLGNISERYGYFAAIGFAFVFVVWARSFFENAKTRKAAVGVIIAVLIFIFWKNLVNNELLQWQKASKITYTTLGYFRLEQANIVIDSKIYIVNMPTRYGNAWIFPVGFSDGLWFIYRNPLLEVVQVKSAEEAMQMKKDNPSVAPAKDYIFEFDKDGNLSSIN